MPMLVTPITDLVVEETLKDFLIHSKKLIFVVHTNDGYHKFIEEKVWIVKKVSYTWHIV